jgi:glycosyltransferase involved in cell wall biosynthesis
VPAGARPRAEDLAIVDAHPFVSIIIPTLNSAKTIVPCLEAIDALEFPRDRREVIIADHGSTDRKSTRLNSSH